MNRIDRLLAVLTALQSKKFVQAEYLSEKFGISVRTVYRDIRALEEIGVPVYFENGKGYSISKGYFLPPVMFSPEEANALALLETIADQFTDLSIKKHYASAMIKIKALLRDSQKEETEIIRTSTRIWAYPQPIHEKEWLSEIQQAITRKTILRIGYSNAEQKKSSREIEPIGLTYYSLSWHCIAWCHQRKAYRDFKIDRISQLINTGKPFSIATHIGIMEYIRSLEEN